MCDSYDKRLYAERMLEGLVSTMHSTVEDVARWMISLARQHGANKTIEVTYARTVLHAREDSKVSDICRQFESQCYSRWRQALA